MEKKLRCDDLIPGCDFEAKGTTEEEVLQQAAAHAKNEHGLQITAELAEKVRQAIKDV